MLLAWDLGISSLVLVISTIFTPLFAFFIRRKWIHAVKRREEIQRLLIHASQEAARAELEATRAAELEVSVSSSVSSGLLSVGGGFQCPVCYCPATHRCSRCKAVRYCSGKCQIVHWRQGHKDECRPNETLLLDGDKDDLIDKEEEAVSVAETSGSSFSGFSSSPRNDSGDENSRCDSFSSSDSDGSESLHDAHVEVELEETCVSTVDDAHVEVELEETCISSTVDDANVSTELEESCTSTIDDTPLSPKFLRLVESVHSPANSTHFSPHKPRVDDAQNQSQSRGLHSGVTEPRPGLADPSSVSSSDFWGTTLGPVECVRENCDNSNSGGPSKSSRDTSAVKVDEHRSRILEEGPKDVLGTGSSANEVNLRERNAERSKISLSTSSFTDALSPLNTSVMSTVTLRKSKGTSSESGCMSDPLKVGEAKPLASKALYTSECADFVKPSPLGAKCGKVLDRQKRNGNSQHGSNGVKASVLKVGDLSTRPKPSAENGMAERHGHKELFPYECFVKLYVDKAEFQPCGLMNCGNTCFANVVFQCLMFTPPLTTYFLQQFHSRACPSKEQCFTCGFENLVLKARERKSPLSPDWLLLRLQNTGIFLGNGKQEDAHEFLRFVVDTMQSVSIKASEHNMPKTKKLEDTTIIGLTFGGYLRSKIKCMKCQGKSEQREKMMDLTLEIDGDISTLDDALRRFTSTEVLDGENKYICGRCKSYQRAKKKLKIMEPPNVLTIALKRFQPGKFGKLNKLIRFPETLDLAPYISGRSDKSHDYKLYGVIVHLDRMNAAFSGHYVCYIRNSQNMWFKADDSTVVTSGIEGILTKNAYMLFYARCSPMPPRLACAKTEASNKKSSMPVAKTNAKPVASTSPLVPRSSSGGQSGNIKSFYSSFQKLKRILENESSSESNLNEYSDSTSMDDSGHWQEKISRKGDNDFLSTGSTKSK